MDIQSNNQNSHKHHGKHKGQKLKCSDKECKALSEAEKNKIKQARSKDQANKKRNVAFTSAADGEVEDPPILELNLARIPTRKQNLDMGAVLIQ